MRMMKHALAIAMLLGLLQPAVAAEINQQQQQPQAPASVAEFIERGFAKRVDANDEEAALQEMLQNAKDDVERYKQMCQVAPENQPEECYQNTPIH